MTARKTRQPDFNAVARKRFGRGVERQIGPHTARTACGHNAELLAVKVQHPPRGQERVVKRVRAVHSDLLRRGEQAFIGGVGGQFAVQKRQHHGNGNAVVAAERSSPRAQILPVNPQLQRVVQEVVHRVAVLFAYHVGVSLQQQRRGAGTVGGGGSFDEHVVLPVAGMLQTARRRKRAKVVGNAGFVVRTARNRADFLKVTENRFGLPSVNDIFHIRISCSGYFASNISRLSSDFPVPSATQDTASGATRVLIPVARVTSWSKP